MSTGGVWIHNITAAILAFQLTGSAFVVGLVSIVQFAPQMVLAPLSGAMADRGVRRRQIVAGRLMVAAGSGGLALWLWLVGVKGLPGPWVVLLGALVVGVGFVIGSPAMSALLPTMVRPGELAAAIGLDNVPVTVSRAVGPALGALVAASAGPAAAFALAALGNTIFAVTMMILPIGGRVVVPDGADRRMRAGLRHVQGDPTLIRLLVGVAAVAIGADPAITLTPPLSHAFGQGTHLVGVFASAFGGGALLALPLMSSAQRRLGEAALTTVSLCLLGAGIVSLTVAPTPALTIVGFAAAGAGIMSGLTRLTTQIQHRLPDALRGRVMALWAVAFLGSRPIASALDVSLADQFSLDTALLVVSLIVFAVAWVTRPSRIAPFR